MELDQTLTKVYELEAKILAQGAHLKKVPRIYLLFFLKTEGIPIALATSSAESRPDCLDSNGILSLFDHLVFAKDVMK